MEAVSPTQLRTSVSLGSEAWGLKLAMATLLYGSISLTPKSGRFNTGTVQKTTNFVVRWVPHF